MGFNRGRDRRAEWKSTEPEQSVLAKIPLEEGLHRGT